MKKNIFNLLFIATTITLISGCKPGDFGDLNVSPNSPTKPVTSLMLTNAERFLGRSTLVTSTATAPGVINAYAPKLFVQQISETLYTNESTYNLKIYDYSNIYNNPLIDLNTIIDLNTNPETQNGPNVNQYGSPANQIAVARILRAFYFQNMTDRWGDIPYTEALKGKSLLTPKFDKQQDIYTSLFKELKEAAAQFDNGDLPVGDILFNGSIARWKMFAATIRMNMALRMSKADPATGRTEFNLALAAGVINSNADNIVYKFLAESTNANNIYYNYEVARRYDYAISDIMVNKLASYTDPRLPVYADPTAAGTYVGMPYGLSQELASDYTVGNVNVKGNVSLIGKAFRSQDSPVRIFTYPEVLFSRAEAYKLGWITGAPDDGLAATTYLAGIAASMELNGVTAPVTYFTQAGVAYNPATGREQIITQKWIANYMGYGFEAWSDFRRTGFPVLRPSAYAFNIGGQIPVRQGYSNDEPSLNRANYNAVVASQGPDELNTPIWLFK